MDTVAGSEEKVQTGLESFFPGCIKNKQLSVWVRAEAFSQHNSDHGSVKL